MNARNESASSHTAKSRSTLHERLVAIGNAVVVVVGIYSGYSLAMLHHESMSTQAQSIHECRIVSLDESASSLQHGTFQSTLDRGTLIRCGHFGIQSTSRWTDVAIIVW